MAKNRKVMISKRGGPDVLKLVEEELPEPGAGEARVKITAAGVAFADVLMREGLYPGVPKPPFAPGYDVVGTVDALGEGVTGFTIGTRVAALTRIGGYADYLCVPAESLVPVPDGVDAAEAVALVLNFLTAWQMLHRCARLQRGERVLIHGAGGGVGDALLQLGKLAGLALYGTASRAKHAAIAAAGATAIDYRSEDFVARVKELTGDGVDAVFDAVGGKQWKRSFQALRVGGMLVGYGFSSATVNGRRSLPKAATNYLGMPRFHLLGLMDATRSVMGYNVMVMKAARPEWYREDLAMLLGLLQQGKIRPAVAERVPLAEAAHAHRLLGGAEIRGKLVLLCGT
ncbi:MAG: oxidoreductase, zinc-binding dehydrogenase family protein [Myxococcales bacterium]|nr:oxidoreductase, zinc-binding dehydrogenase family protein [Myxococcales bacterium]